MAETVTLVAPDGGEHAVSSPTLLNRYVFSFGHRLAEAGLSVEHALARLAGHDQPEPAPLTETVVTETSSAGAPKTPGAEAEDSTTD